MLKINTNLKFFKLHGSGNDFILIDRRYQKRNEWKLGYKDFIQRVCERKFGIGADGVLVIEPSREADFKMRIFNSDGSEAEMCGNGARCASFWAALIMNKNEIKFETKAGILIARAKPRRNNCGEIKLKMTDPVDLKLTVPLKIGKKTYTIDFINTGVPHAVVFVNDLESIDVKSVGKAIRFHKMFSPAGTNVDFVKIEETGAVTIRTYERGVENETLACGTGAVAAAILTAIKQNGIDSNDRRIIKVKVKSQEMLKVNFDYNKNIIHNVWLKGLAYLVFKGEIQV